MLWRAWCSHNPGRAHADWCFCRARRCGSGRTLSHEGSI